MYRLIINVDYSCQLSKHIERVFENHDRAVEYMRIFETGFNLLQKRRYVDRYDIQLISYEERNENN